MSESYKELSLEEIEQFTKLSLEKALDDDKHLLNGLNTYDGKLTNEAVAKSLDIPFEPITF